MRNLRTALNLLAAANLAVVAWDLATGGIYFTVFGIVVSSWEVAKPVGYAAVCAAASLWLGDRSAPVVSWDRIPRWAPRAAAAAAIALVVIAAVFGIRAAGGSDGYGYVSEAKLWVDRTLIAPDPLAPFTRRLGSAAAPVGYRLGPQDSSLAPVCPPGLPLMMAAAQWVGGGQAVYAVVPLLAGIAVWMTFLVGARAVDARVGAVAAIALASNPVFLFQALEPMSDVPATAWWTAAWAMSLLPGSLAAFGVGVSAAAAILTRPNLAPLILPIAAVVAASPPRARRIAIFAAPAAAGCLIVFAFNHALYGSGVDTGYGPVWAMFASKNFGRNLAAYSRWTFDLLTPVVLLGFGAPWIVRRPAVRWMLVFCVGVLLSYLFYIVFDNWPFERFLLPAMPLLYVTTAAVVVRAIARLPMAARTVTLIVAVALLLTHHIGVAQRLQIFQNNHSEQRYATVGRFVGCALPPRAVVFATVHSGSVRLYGNRLTVRWESLPDDALDGTVAMLREAGYPPYLLLEDWEEPLF